MSADFKLTQLQWDLSVVDGKLATVAESEEVMQRTRIRLQRDRGEWFLNTTVGLPWYGNGILGSKNPARSELLIRQEIMATVGVSAIVEFNPLWDDAARELALYAQITTTYGTPQEVKVNIGE